MSIISCFKRGCNIEAEFTCNCTSPATFSCENHWAEHCRSSNKAHNFSPIILKSFEQTKCESLLNSDSVEYMNFEDEPSRIRAELNKYKEAIRIDQYYIKLYSGIGIKLVNQNRYEEALEYFDDAIRIDPNDAINYYSKALALNKLGRREKQWDAIKKSLELIQMSMMHTIE